MGGGGSPRPPHPHSSHPQQVHGWRGCTLCPRSSHVPPPTPGTLPEQIKVDIEQGPRSRAERGGGGGELPPPDLAGGGRGDERTGCTFTLRKRGVPFPSAGFWYSTNRGDKGPKEGEHTWRGGHPACPPHLGRGGTASPGRGSPCTPAASGWRGPAGGTQHPPFGTHQHPPALPRTTPYPGTPGTPTPLTPPTTTTTTSPARYCHTTPPTHPTDVPVSQRDHHRGTQLRLWRDTGQG